MIFLENENYNYLQMDVALSEVLLHHISLAVLYIAVSVDHEYLIIRKNKQKT